MKITTQADYDELVRLAGIHKEWIFGLDGNRIVASGAFGYVPVKKGTFEFVTSDTVPINIAAAIAEMESKTETNEKCPICEYEISGCQCLYSGSAHPDRNDKRRVVFDHLYLLSPMQLQHVISLEKHWQISYADADLNAILKKLLLNSPYAEGETKNG